MSGVTTALDTLLEGALRAHETRTAPAAVIAVCSPDGVLATRAIGEPRRDGAETGPDTVFRIASMTKSFLAATALALRDEGRFDLDRDIAELVPGTRLLWRGNVVPVTARELLSNRSGLPEDNAWGDRQLGADRAEIARLAEAGLRLTAEPGERYQYSNLGMSLVGRAIERITGGTVEAAIEGRFLDPLGMSHTRFTPDALPAGSDLAAGYRTFDDGQSFVSEPFVGSGALACIGGLFSTVADVASWIAFLASAHTAHPIRPELLSAASRRELQRAVTPIPAGPAEPGRGLDALGYGLGLVIEHDRRFGKTVQHSGGLPGFSSHMRWHADTGIGVIAFGNSDAFGAEKLAIAALSAVLAERDVPAETVRLWPETTAALRSIDAALIAGEPVSGLTGMFAENALRDVPAEVRERRLAETLTELGAISSGQTPLAERLRASEGPANARWVIAAERGELLAEVRLIGLPEPLVQTLTVTAAGPDGATAPGRPVGVVTRARVLLDEGAGAMR